METKNKLTYIVLGIIVLGIIITIFSTLSKKADLNKPNTSIKATPTPLNSYFDEQKDESQAFYTSAHSKGMSDKDIAYYFDISCNDNISPITDEQRNGVTRIDSTGQTYTATFDTSQKTYNESRSGSKYTENYDNELRYSVWTGDCENLLKYDFVLSLKPNSITSSVLEQCKSDFTVICPFTQDKNPFLKNITPTPVVSQNDSFLPYWCKPVIASWTAQGYTIAQTNQIMKKDNPECIN